MTFGGVSWREAPETAAAMFAVLPVMRQLHEMLSHLGEALALAPGEAIEAELVVLRDEVEALTGEAPELLLALDLAAVRSRARPAAAAGQRRSRGRGRRGRQTPKTLPRRVGPGRTCSAQTSDARICGPRTCAART